MKPNLVALGILLLSILFSEMAMGQEGKQQVYSKDEVAEVAVFPGGKDSLNNFLRAHIEYPRRAIMNGEKIKRPLLEAEALRVVQLFPEYIPAKNKSGKARTYEFNHQNTR